MSIHLLLVLGLLTAAPKAPLDSSAPMDGADEAAPTACYVLQPPGSAWRALEPAELRVLAPGALAGLAGPRGVRVLLHAGPDRHRDLEASLREELDGQGLLQGSVAFVEETDVGGRRALRGMINGKREGAWTRYHALVFREGPDLYRLVGWGRSDMVPADGSTFEEASAGLRRVEGVTLDLLPRGGIHADADGPGWTVRDGVYRDGALGFELDPRGPWRVALEKELAPLATFSHVGLVDEQHDALFSVAVERVHGAEQGPLAELRRRQALGEAFVSGELELTAQGRKVTLRLATVPALPGTEDVTRQLAVGVLLERDLCIQLIGRYPAADAKALTKALEQALASLRVLGAEESAMLASELTAVAPALDGVGKGWSLRGRTFTSFAHGLRWVAPTGFWEVQGRDALGDQGRTLAWLHERRTGLRGSILAAPAAGLDQESWHAAEVQRLLAPRGDTIEAPRQVTLGEVTGLLTIGELRESSGLVGLVATCVRGESALRLVVSGSRDVVAGLSGLAQESVAALQVAREPLAPTEMAPGAYVDLRLGFALTSPDAAWSFHEAKLDRYGPTAAPADGVVAGFEAARGHGLFVAAAWTQAPPLADGALGPYIPTPLRSLARLPDRSADEDIRATLRGRPCRLLSWREEGRRIDVALLWRGRTALAVCAAAPAAEGDPRAWLSGFRLLE